MKEEFTKDEPGFENRTGGGWNIFIVVIVMILLLIGVGSLIIGSINKKLAYDQQNAIEQLSDTTDTMVSELDSITTILYISRCSISHNNHSII